ncbi:MAG: hypothetical protein R2710_02255 [Acidimicrobiales bacterium]
MAERPTITLDDLAAWFAGRTPDDWFDGAITVRADRDEIIVTGRLPLPSASPEGAEAGAIAAQSRIAAFREETRLDRMKIADAAQQRFQRHVSWEAACGEVQTLFTNASIPVMTRLRFDERQVLDTLIDSGVARSRSEALAWCVSQVATHQSEWIDRLREAMSEVERIRQQGPT